VLDEVVVASSVEAGVREKLEDRVPLMEAREDDRALPSVVLGDVDESAQDVEPVVALPDVLPQVRSGVLAAGAGRVALAVVLVAVERQERRLLAREPGGEINLVCVEGEVGDGAPGEDGLRGLAVLAVSLG